MKKYLVIVVVIFTAVLCGWRFLGEIHQAEPQKSIEEPNVLADGPVDGIPLDGLEESEVRQVARKPFILSGRVMVKDGPQIAPRELTKGSLLLESGGVVEVNRGEWTVDGFEDSAPVIVGAFENGRELGFLRVAVEGISADTVLVAYNYPGFFTKAMDSDSSSLPTYSVIRERDTHGGLKHQHPGSVTHCVGVVSDATGWTYIPTDPSLDGRFWITAPGWSWAKLEERNVKGGGAHPVSLQAAGGLEVSILNHAALRNLRLVVEPASGSGTSVDYVVHRESYIAMRGLLPGTYKAFLAFDPRATAKDRVSDEVEFEVRESNATKIEVELHALASRLSFGSLSLNMTVEALPLWREIEERQNELGVVIRAIGSNPTFGSMNEAKKAARYNSMDGFGVDDGSVSTRVWDVGEFPPGDYEFEVSPLGYKERFRVDANKHAEVQVIVPEPGIVLARFTYAGRPLAGVRVLHGMMGAEGSSKSVGSSNEKGEVREVFLPGEQTLTAVHRRHGIQEMTVVVEPGWNAVNWSFPEPLEIFLSAVDSSGEQIEMTREVCWGLNFDSTASSGICMTKRAQFPKPTTSATIAFSEPGTYRVSTKGASEWEVVGEPTITVGQGAEKRWSISMKKREASGEAKRK